MEKVHSILSISKGSTELIAELNTLYQCIRYTYGGVKIESFKYLVIVIAETLCSFDTNWFFGGFLTVDGFLVVFS